MRTAGVGDLTKSGHNIQKGFPPFLNLKRYVDESSLLPAGIRGADFTTVDGVKGIWEAPGSHGSVIAGGIPSDQQDPYLTVNPIQVGHNNDAFIGAAGAVSDDAVNAITDAPDDISDLQPDRSEIGVLLEICSSSFSMIFICREDVVIIKRSDRPRVPIFIGFCFVELCSDQMAAVLSSDPSTMGLGILVRRFR